MEAKMMTERGMIASNDDYCLYVDSFQVRAGEKNSHRKHESGIMVLSQCLYCNIASRCRTNLGSCYVGIDKTIAYVRNGAIRLHQTCALLTAYIALFDRRVLI